MSKLHPCLWFDTQAEDAARFYVDIFKGQASMGPVVRKPEGVGPSPSGVMTASFTLRGLDFLALNGGPMFTHSPAISMVAHAKDQAELDRLWDGLLAGGGQPSQCGWLTDRFGVSWQVVPEQIGEWMTAGPAQSAAVMGVVMGMVKLDISAMQAAFDGAQAEVLA